jgi:prepilin-type N-terminal cleavage/methylation domain-containing protein
MSGKQAAPICQAIAMRTRQQPSYRQPGTERSAFTIIEVIMAIAVLGVLILALYSGMSTAIFSTRLARENLRATEILLEKMEGIRLYSWDQVLTPGFIPTNFISYYYDDGNTNNTGIGIAYTGSVVMTSFPLTSVNYSNELRQVDLVLNWVSGGIPRSRSLTTYLARHGLQNHIME